MKEIRGSRLALPLLAVAVSSLVVIGAVGAALRLPVLGVIGGYSDVTALDYKAANGGAFSPLTNRFLASILGRLLPDPQGRLEPAGPSARNQTAATLSSRRLDVTHPFTNGDFADAYPIPSVPFTGHTNTAGAVQHAGEPTSCAPVGGSAWYRYTPSLDTALLSDTFGTSYAAALGVFTGTALSNLTQVGCDKNAQGNAQWGFTAHKGATYFFQITGPVGGGNLVFNLDPIGRTDLGSASSAGEPGNQSVYFRNVLSPDGRYLLFSSFADNLAPMHRDCNVPHVCNGIFLRDLRAGTTQSLVTTSYYGTVGAVPFAQTFDAEATESDVSCCVVALGGMTPDGRYVVFESTDPTLVPDKTNQNLDVFVLDRVTGHIERDSVASDGSEAHSNPVFNTHIEGQAGPTGSGEPSISADGRYVLFDSDADNLGGLVGPDPSVSPTSGQIPGHIHNSYVHDRLTGKTELVSIAPDGHPFTTDTNVCFGNNLSADGRFAVMFAGFGSSENDPQEVYLRDLQARTTTLVTRGTDGNPGDSDSSCAAISADGSHVGFLSTASNLAGGSGNGFFEWDRLSGRFTRVSVSSSGQSASTATDVHTSLPSIVTLSADGRYSTFATSAGNLVPGDTNNHWDCFVHDLVTGSTIRVSVSSTGAQGDQDSSAPSISGDGSTVAFESFASNFGPPNPSGLLYLYVHQVIR